MVADLRLLHARIYRIPVRRAWPRWGLVLPPRTAGTVLELVLQGIWRSWATTWRAQGRLTSHTVPSARPDTIYAHVWHQTVTDRPPARAIFLQWKSAQPSSSA